jgi:hypothetical protein
MNQEKRLARRVPTLVVQHDSEDGDLVALCDPVDGAGDGEEIGAVADDLADKLLVAAEVGREFDAESLYTLA